MKSIAYILILFIATSCSTMFHYPSSPNIPIMDTIQTVSFGGDITSNGGNAKANIRLYKNLGIQGCYHRKLGNRSFSDGEHYYEGGVFYFKQLSEFTFGISSGFGQGKINFDESDEFYGFATYHKYYIEPTLLESFNRRQLGFTLKASYMDYTMDDIFSDYDNNPSEGKTYGCYTLEPTIFYRYVPDDHFMFSMYLGKPLFISDIEFGELKNIPVLFGLGIRISFTKRYK